MHQFTVPIYLGDHPVELLVKYDCVLDFTVPAIFVANEKCVHCEGTRFNSTHRNPVLRNNLKYPLPIMYWKYSDAEYTLDEELWPMTIDYDPRLPLADNYHFEDFEFFSIIEDRADQQID